MKFRMMGWALVLMLAGALVWAFYPTLGAYDPGAEGVFKISKVELQRDHSDYWLTLHLTGDLPAQVGPEFGLLTASGKKVRGVRAEGQDLPCRFWIHATDLEQSLRLELAGQSLVVKASEGLPELENGGFKTFHKSDWD